MAERIRVLVADDHPIVHTAAKFVVQDEGIDIVATVSTWTAAVEAYPAVRPDVVLMDVNIPPDDGGLEGARQILALDPEARVVAYSMGGNMRLVEAALTAGCMGFLSKNSPASEMAPVLRKAYEREEALDASTATTLIRSLRARVESRRQTGLSDRDIDILQLLAEGLSNSDIAEKLHVARSTVANQITSLFEKLQVNDRTAAAITAMRRGIID